MKETKHARPYTDNIAVVVYWEIICVISILVVSIVFLFSPEKPAACATDFTDAQVTALVKEKLRYIGYTDQDLSSVALKTLSREQGEWPSYYFEFSVYKNGKLRRISANGNGCGIGDVFDYPPFVLNRIGK
jgi:hypothetical protein